MRLALCLEYDGGMFCGWQAQASGKSVQDALERAVAAVAAEPVRVVCAGRTDAGVHATSQIVHFDTLAQRPLTAWVRGVNAHLPASVAVRAAQVVADDFHARFSATARHYSYLLLNRPQRPGLLGGRVGWTHYPLDVAAMRTAALHLLGEHDFSAFRSAECQAKSPVRTLRRLDIERRGDLIVFNLGANAFLHHMVRNLVGSLIAVGAGKREPGWLAEVLEGADRTRAAATFSPAGLYLTGVDYDPRWSIKVSHGEAALPLPASPE